MAIQHKLSGKEICSLLHSKLLEAYLELNKLATQPDNQKKLKTWSISEAAEMIGRSTQTLRRIDEKDNLPKPDIQQKKIREDRQYTLELINQLRNHFGTRPRKPEKKPPAILAFVNFKGGVGKTTKAVDCAQFFALKGYRVLIVDGDSQGSATHMFGYIPDASFSEEDTILQILTGESTDIRPYIKKTYWDGLDLVPANLGLYNAELILPTKIAQHASKGESFEFYALLDRALKTVYEEYDIIILDLPPSMGMISINGIWAANILTTGMPPTMIDFASTSQFFKMTAEILERLPEKTYDWIKIFNSKHDNRVSSTKMNLLLQRYAGEYFMTNYMVESEAVRTAAANMQTLYEMDRALTDKKTYERAIGYANKLNEEIHELIKIEWQYDVNSKNETEN